MAKREKAASKESAKSPQTGVIVWAVIILGIALLTYHVMSILRAPASEFVRTHSSIAPKVANLASERYETPTNPPITDEPTPTSGIDLVSQSCPDSPYTWRPQSISTGPRPWIQDLGIEAPSVAVETFQNEAFVLPDGTATKLRGVVATAPIPAGSAVVRLSNHGCLPLTSSTQAYMQASA